MPSLPKMNDVIDTTRRVPVRVDGRAVVCAGVGASFAALSCTAAPCIAGGALFGLAVYGADRAIRLGRPRDVAV